LSSVLTPRRRRRRKRLISSSSMSGHVSKRGSLNDSGWIETHRCISMVAFLEHPRRVPPIYQLDKALDRSMFQHQLGLLERRIEGGSVPHAKRRFG
jgi:hypothetical protein